MPLSLNSNGLEIDEVLKIRKKEAPKYKTINNVRSGEFPFLLDYMNHMESLLLNTPLNNDPERLLRFSKDLRKRISRTILDFICYFNFPKIVLHWEELDIENNDRYYVPYKVNEDRSSAKVGEVVSTNWEKDKKSKEEIDNIIDYIFKYKIFTPLIVEPDSKNKRALMKYFLEMKGKGELFKYNKKMIQDIPVKTVFYPIEFNGEIISVLEILLSEKDDCDLFVNSFLRFLNSFHSKLSKMIFSLKASQGNHIYRLLLKDHSLTQTEYNTKGIVFFDIAEYSKLSLKLNDPNQTEEENETFKVELLNVFHYVVSEVISQFDHCEIDKLVGDMVMLLIDEDRTIEYEDERMAELAQRGFTICWNLDIALRTVNRQVKEMFEEKGLDILNEKVYNEFIRQTANKKLYLDLIHYSPKKKKNNRKLGLSIPYIMLLRYYYILKKYKIENGLEVRMGFNIGPVLKINMGGIRIDTTVIGKDVDLASRMENLGKKNAVKMPLKVFKHLSEPFKNFVISEIVRMNKLTNTNLTYQMVFRKKKENPKGSRPIGTVEFNSNIGHQFRQAEKHFEKLEKLFYEFSPESVYEKVENYIAVHKVNLISNAKIKNPELSTFTDEQILEKLKLNQNFRHKIKNHVTQSTEQKIFQYLDDISQDKALYKIIRNFVMNRNMELFKKFFKDKSLMSETAKRKYLQETFFNKIQGKIDFSLLSKKDIEELTVEMYNKIYGKAE